VDFTTSDLVVKASIGFWTIVGAVIGARIGGTTGAIVGGAVGLAIGLIISVVADELLLDERGCIWWWISEDFLDWVVANQDLLLYYIINNPVTATILITTVFNICGYSRVGLVTLFDAIEVKSITISSTDAIHLCFFGWHY
jgi:hypothetical protein